MTKHKLKVKDTTWMLFKEDNSWVTVKYMRSQGGLSRTQFRAMDMGAALQYIWSTYSGSIDPLRVEDVEEITEVRFG